MAWYEIWVSQYSVGVWDPSELPSPLVVDDFALVPSFSARGIVEVKRTETDVEKLRKQLIDRVDAVPDIYKRYTLGIVVRHKEKLFEGEVTPDWVDKNDPKKPMITRLLNESGEPDLDGIFALIYMISHLCGHRGVLGSMGK